MRSESEISVERGVYKGGALTASDHGTCASETWQVGLCWTEGMAENNASLFFLLRSSCVNCRKNGRIKSSDSYGTLSIYL